MRAYKAFGSDLKCRGYRFSETGWNEEPEANCAENGFHCAENPLDCLTYYPDMDRSVYYLVEAAGDIDEDGNDSKISCTRIKLVKKLDIKAFVTAALAYIIRHPDRPDGPGVCRENGCAENLKEYQAALAKRVNKNDREAAARSRELYHENMIEFYQKDAERAALVDADYMEINIDELLAAAE